MCPGRCGSATAEEQKASGGYNAKGKRDPFVPLVRDGRVVDVTSATPTYTDVRNPVLTGILYDPGGNSLALINELEAKVGERIGDFRVAEIRQDAVVLKRPDGTSVTLTISFEEEASKQSPQDSKRR